MPGEDPFTVELTDVRHWLKVYSQLHDFTVGTLDRYRTETVDLRARSQDIGPSRDDVRIYERHLQRLAQRLAFWNGRLAQLQARRGR